jgi:hypothetical protein
VLGFFPLLHHSSIPILPRSEALGAFLRWVVERVFDTSQKWEVSTQYVAIDKKAGKG